MIRLVDALNLMNEMDQEDKPVPFSIKFVTFNRRNDTGGELISIDQAVKCITKRKGKIVYDLRKMTTQKKPPNHFKNSTRNINIVGTDQIRKCNIRLITEFNGQKVIW